MAWVWWLLAPVASTLLGGLVLTIRAAAEPGQRLRRFRDDPMADHRALLAALAMHGPQGTCHSPDPDLDSPVSVRVLDGDHVASLPS